MISIYDQSLKTVTSANFGKLCDEMFELFTVVYNLFWHPSFHGNRRAIVMINETNIISSISGMNKFLDENCIAFFNE